MVFTRKDGVLMGYVSLPEGISLNFMVRNVAIMVRSRQIVGAALDERQEVAEGKGHRGPRKMTTTKTSEIPYLSNEKNLVV